MYRPLIVHVREPTVKDGNRNAVCADRQRQRERRWSAALLAPGAKIAKRRSSKWTLVGVQRVQGEQGLPLATYGTAWRFATLSELGV